VNTQIDIESFIQRYLADEISDREAQQMEDWLKENEGNRQLFARHKKIWLGGSALAGYDADKIRQGRKKVDLKICDSERNENKNTNFNIINQQPNSDCL